MAASTVLEIVRMASSAIGAVFAFLSLVMSYRSMRRVHAREISTREEMFQQEADAVHSIGTGFRLLIFMVIQIGMFVVAKQAYYVTDDPTAPISQLALSSNLNQILVTALITMVTLWDFRDLRAQLRIERMASFVPTRKAAARSARRREMIEVDD